MYQTTTYLQDHIPDLTQAYQYSPTPNPTPPSLQTLIPNLQHPNHAFPFASPITPITPLIILLHKPHHLLLNSHLYPPTYPTLTKLFTPFPIHVDFVHTTKIEN
ncbi:PLP-dependent transferase, partial [Staphylococcus epidermidis]|uniref:PLP-dependent transferase n=1 Tax=Staphylococcus epidermidis TaxID=1282 RepID=UPI0037DA241B